MWCRVKGGTVKCCLPPVPDMTDDLPACYAITLPAWQPKARHLFMGNVNKYTHACLHKYIPLQNYIQSILVSPVAPQFKYRLLWNVSVCPSPAVCGGSHNPFQVAWLAGWGKWERLIMYSDALWGWQHVPAVPGHPTGEQSGLWLRPRRRQNVRAPFLSTLLSP